MSNTGRKDGASSPAEMFGSSPVELALKRSVVRMRQLVVNTGTGNTSVRLSSKYIHTRQHHSDYSTEEGGDRKKITIVRAVL